MATLTAIIACIAATTPLLIRVVQQAALDHALASVSVLDRSVVGDASSNDAVSPAGSRDRAAKVTSVLGGSGVWSLAHTFREQNDDPLKWTRPKIAAGQPVQRLADIPSCRDLRFVAGRCPERSDEAALAESTVTDTGIRLGDRISLASTLHEVSVEVVGVYDSTDANGPQQAHPSAMVGAPTTGLDPDLLLAPTAFTDLRLPTTSFSIRSLSVHLPLSDVAAIRSDIARAEAVPLTTAGAQASTHVHSSLVALLDRIDEQRDVVAVILDVVAVGGFALALVAFAVVAGRLGRVRAREWALPRLRGMPRRRRLAARFIEPAIAMVGGALLGAVVAVAAAVLLVDPTTRRSVLIAVPAAAGSAAAATAGCLVVLALIVAAPDRRPLDEQLRRSTEPRELSRGALVGEAVVVVAALAAVVALLVDPGTDIGGAGLLAPVLVALAIGFVGLQLALALVRRRTRRVPSSLVSVIVWRRLSRSPSQMIAAVLVAAAVALGSFVTLTAATADVRATSTAQARSAAATVLHVRVPAALSLMSAVQRADPSGTRAMAAVESAAGTGTSRVLAVDTARLAAVSTWRSTWSDMTAAQLRRRLAPPVHPSLALRGSRLTIAADEITPGPIDEGAERFELEVTLQSSRGLSVVPMGSFEATGARTFAAAVPCADGCTFVSLAVRCTDQYPPPWSMHLVLTRMATDEQPAGRFRPSLTRGAWMSENGHVENQDLPITSSARPGVTGLAVDLVDTLGASHPAVRVRDTVEPLPAVLGAITTADPFPGSTGTFAGAGVDGSALLLRSVGRASALPRLLGDGVLVDLRRMLPQVDRSSTGDDEQVWVTGDPTAVERRLRGEGVTVLRTELLTADESAERAEAGPLSSRFAVIGALAALAVVLTAFLGGRLLGAPARRRQWSSFAAAGVPLPVMRRLVALEFFVPVAAAVAIGALSGAATFLLALPHLPLSDGAPEAPPDGVPLPWGLIAVFPVIALVVALAMTAVATRVETRPDGPGDRA